MNSIDKPSLLILTRAQFGYHADTYYYCKYAAEGLSITYVGFDMGRPKLHRHGVQIRYIPYRGSKYLCRLRLLRAFAREIRRHRGVVFVKYFPGCSLLRLFGRRRLMAVDCRTSSVNGRPITRWLANWLIRWECRFFRNISVISEGLAGRLRLPQHKVHILPLGAERLDLAPKQFNRLDLLYVGTLYHRRIEETVTAFSRFRRDYGAKVAMTYTIVGDGHNGELDTLRKMVHALGLGDVVHLPGYVHKTQLLETFTRCNIGVSYVPINDIYDCQPVTKTFEYIFAGMPVIATATTENAKVINSDNGVLIQDSCEGFYLGLEQIYKRQYEFDSRKVRCCSEASWDSIVNRNLVPYIHRIYQS